MLIVIRLVWLVATIINLCAVVWFIFGTTANFQRGIDLVSTTILILIGIPSIVLIALSIVLFIKSWQPTTLWGGVSVIVLSVGMLVLSPTLFRNVNTEGWLTERVVTDTMQTTTDGKYEYQLEVINLHQKNSYARIYLRSVSSKEEFRIPLQMDTNLIEGISLTSPKYWISIEETLDPRKYIMKTTEHFPLRDEKYSIDLSKITAEQVD